MVGLKRRFVLPDDGKLHYFELFVSLVMMFAVAGSTGMALFLSEGVSLASLAFFVLFFAFVIAHVMRRREGKRTRGSAWLHLLFVAMAAAFLLSIFVDARLAIGELVEVIVTLYSLSLFFVLFMPLFFFTFFAAYFIRVKRDYRAAAILFLVVLLVLILYFSSNFLMKGYTFDDEELLSLNSVRLMLNGTDPYSVSMAGSLYGTANVSGVTVTANNQIMGVMDYPALFFLSFAPFYFASPPNMHGLSTVDIPLQAVAFIFVLLIIFGFVIRKEDLLRPRFLLLAALAFPLAYISSTTSYLMLGLLLLAYAKIDSKYAWIPLGLCLAIQEELWLPVLFLLAYSLNRRGIWRAAYNAAGAAAVFLAANAYFIALGPAAYLGEVFSPLNGLILPKSPSPFAFVLLKGFPVLLSAYSQIFELSAALLLLAFLYADRKELVPVFSFIALLLIPHVLITYYALFLFFIMFAVCTGRDGIATGAAAGALRKRGWILYSLAAALVACIALVVLLSHATYVRNFNVSLVNQSLTQNAIGKTTSYRANLVYGNLGNYTAYLVADAHGGVSTEWMGLMNQTLVPSGAVCGPGAGYVCSVNTNRLALPENRTGYEVTLNLPWINGTTPVTYVAVVLYNGEYFYIGNGTAYSGG